MRKLADAASLVDDLHFCSPVCGFLGISPLRTARPPLKFCLRNNEFTYHDCRICWSASRVYNSCLHVSCFIVALYLALYVHKFQMSIYYSTCVNITIFTEI